MAKSFENKKGIPFGIPFLIIVSGEPRAHLVVVELVGEEALADEVEPVGAEVLVGAVEPPAVCGAVYDEVLGA